MPKTYSRRSGPVAGIVAALCVATAVPAAAAEGVQVELPTLTGPYRVGTTQLHLVDSTRADPWVPAQRRELMVTVDYPVLRVGDAPRAPWLSAGVAAAVDTAAAGEFGLPSGTVDWTATQRRAYTGVPADPALGKRPLVVFSHGFNVPRELYSVLVDDLASRGYVVVSISHTHEAAAVEFPGGRVETELEPGTTEAGQKKALDTRVADTRFVLDQLTRLARGADPDAEHRPLPRGLGATLDLSRVGMFGHSSGGFTAAEAMLSDRRIDAGIDLDGALGGAPDRPGTVAERGLDRPFLLFGAETTDAAGNPVPHNHVTGADRSWTDFWAAQRGWKRDLTLRGGTHFGLSDFQIAVPQFGALLSPQARQAVIGTIDPARSETDQHDYIAAFFDLHLRARDHHLFTGPSPTHPEITFN